MLSDSSIKQIAQMFCGDIQGYYTYKSGPQLVSFFNSYYSLNDTYGQGFPSRWAYVYDKIVLFQESGRFDGFLDIILSKDYLMKEQSLGMIEAVSKSSEICDAFRKVVHGDLFLITEKDGHYHLVEENKDLELIGSGGFANVYKQKSTGLILKQLKDDYLTDVGIRSRFKREYNITKSLSDSYGIIKAYSFSEENCSYTMELAESTLEKYVNSYELSNDIKLNCIRQIVYIMSEVHKRNIIHRDLSPNNIFIVSGQIKIADFGLGKDLNVFTSHQTLYTNAVGQYYYCAPEQFMMLKDADKRSDVYSLGRIINFIMTRDPRNSHHIYRSVAEKATSTDATYRYANATQLSDFLEKAVIYHSREDEQKIVESKLKAQTFDFEVESYIYDMDASKITNNILIDKEGFVTALLVFMKKSDEHAQYIIQCVDKTFKEVCSGSFSAYDPIASFSASIILGDYSFVVKEIASNILHYIAWDINRFSAQHLVDEIINDGIEPMLEDIVKNN